MISRLTEAEIPVMGHVGLTPQSVNAIGGYRVQGKTADAAEQLLRDAHAVEAAGAFAVVLEAVPRELAAQITRELQIPTIGIGAGPDCDGQILVVARSAGPHVQRGAEIRRANTPTSAKLSPAPSAPIAKTSAAAHSRPTPSRITLANPSSAANQSTSLANFCWFCL